MPPAAISRSSTYLPKIWGNIARLHRSALGLALLLSGCGGEPDPPEILPIRARVPDGCAAGKPTSIQLEALGDFDASPLTSETILGEATPDGAPLAFPLDTRAVEARGSSSAARFVGVGELRAEGGIELLLLPDDAACELYRPGANKPYPLATGGEAVGHSRRHRLLLIAGGLAASGDSARALAVDLDTAEAAEVPAGMIPGRAFATVTEFGADALLVAGGLDPREGDPSTAPAIDSAIVYEIGENRFDRSALIPLTAPRARHGAVVLDSGETLLVGGKNDDQALLSLEVVSPADRAARTAGLVGLKAARISPTVLELDDGRVFVGGGRDDSGALVKKLEWLTPDASAHVRDVDVELAAEVAFVALGGGSVLALGVCPKGSISCSAGGLAWIRADSQLDPLDPLTFLPTAPVLVPAANGAPFLIATTPSGSRVVLRFDPWARRFVTPEEAPLPAPAGFTPIAVDPGSFVWLEPFGDALSLRAFRHDTRGAYARDIAPLLVASSAHLAPDRKPSLASGVDYADGKLTLEANGEPPPRALITDTSYETFRLEIVLESKTPPRLALGSALFGDQNCAWPEGDGALVVRRRAGSLSLERGGQTTSCSAPSGRVSLALVAPATGTSVLTSVTVRRGAD